MRPEPGAIGVFGDTEQAARAVRALRQSGYDEVRAALPAPFPAVIEALGRPRSPLDRVALTATLLGAVGGLALCVVTSSAWPLVTGGKPIISVPPFLVVACELALMVGAVGIVVALLFGAAVGGRRRGVPGTYPDQGEDVTLFVPGGDARALGILREHGAKQVCHAK